MGKAVFHILPGNLDGNGTIPRKENPLLPCQLERKIIKSKTLAILESLPY
jgi:hypothetical protein